MECSHCLWDVEDLMRSRRGKSDFSPDQYGWDRKGATKKYPFIMGSRWRERECKKTQIHCNTDTWNPNFTHEQFSGQRVERKQCRLRSTVQAQSNTGHHGRHGGHRGSCRARQAGHTCAGISSPGAVSGGSDVTAQIFHENLELC